MYTKSVITTILLFFNLCLIAQKIVTPYYHSVDYDNKEIKNLDLDSLFKHTLNLKSFAYIEERKKLSIPSSICDLDSLEYIEIAVDKVTLPDCFHSMDKLVYFNLFTRDVVNSNDVFVNMSKMDSLKVFRITAPNYIDSSIFFSVAQIPRVEDVYINLPEIVSIPKTVGDIRFVSKLAIISNNALKLPSSISKLKHLSTFSFYVNWNDDETFKILSELPSLKNISDESGNYCKHISKNLASLSELEEIDINIDFSNEHNIHTLSRLPNLKALFIEVKFCTKSKIASNISLLKHVNRIVLYPKGFWNVLKANKIKKRISRLTNGELKVRVVY